MDTGVAVPNCLLQHTLRSLCSSSDSSKWVYAVFWRIIPRNYPPPKWDYGGSALDRSKGNKRNWILVWEDGYCDFCECERTGCGFMKGRFGADIFFKLSHEVYNYGEGLVGKVAADNSHKWVFGETIKESDNNFISAWSTSIEPQPKAWDFQFASGIQTIAILSVSDGVIQLGSLNKIAEDLNLVINIQRKISYLQSIPGIFTIRRSDIPVHYPYIIKPSYQSTGTQETSLIGSKRMFNAMSENAPIKSINLGWNTPQNGVAGPPVFSLHPLLPTVSCTLGFLLSKLPSVLPSCNNINEPLMYGNNNSINGGVISLVHGVQEQKPACMKTNQDRLGFESLRRGKGAPNLNQLGE